MSHINLNLAASQTKGNFLKIKNGKNSTHIWFLYIILRRKWISDLISSPLPVRKHF